MRIAAGIAFCVLCLPPTSALAQGIPLTDAQLSDVVAGDDFKPINFMIVNQVSDEPSVNAPVTDPLLVNPWGLSQPSAAGPIWTSNNETGTSTLYAFSNFAKNPLEVTIPGAGGAQGRPTGTVFTSGTGTGFQVSLNGVSGHSLFLFDGEDGTISGWAPSVNRGSAIIAVDHSARGASYKGLAVFDLEAGQRLYAADFANNRVEVFNDKFQQTRSFTDTSLPAGYSPFNVQTLNGKVYVAFAKLGPGNEEVRGAGLGFVSVFDSAGNKIQTLVSNGALNAPWGLTIAPASFGKFAGALLVGNFGDGKINAFNPKTGAFLGTLESTPGNPLSIEGLWALRNGPNGSVVFSAGPDDEEHGLLGVVQPTWTRASWANASHVKLGR